ncbi:hypothetical protein SAMN04488096_104220 [Mesonia phycicola]|uniref:Uncharacterized protein n=1 Tax=Mesonia phycicola TaxID=579105 RepID=A0A1M6DX00_9FLAO|nr:hypothetical protein [Mesonia phycicola]SHI77807.1 hypothetical protein SAMN04488096_104220 [Mesonia phycicola]
MKNLYFLFILFFSFQIYAQNSSSIVNVSKDSLLVTVDKKPELKINKFLQNIAFDQINDTYHYPITTTVRNYSFKPTVKDIAQYLYVERPLLKMLYPNYNYLGGHLADWNNNYTPDLISYYGK